MDIDTHWMFEVYSDAAHSYPSPISHPAAATAGAVADRVSIVRLLAGEAVAMGRPEGRFVLRRQTAGTKKLKVDKDLECCGKFDIRDESLMVGPDGGLANVYVYLRSRGGRLPGTGKPRRPKQVVLDNRDCIFQPHCMKIWCAKQEYSIVNSDPVAQNVAFSPLGDVPANIVHAGRAARPRPTEVQPPARARRCRSRAIFIPGSGRSPAAATIPTSTFPPPTARSGSPSCRSATVEFQAWHEQVGAASTRPRGPRAASP